MKHILIFLCLIIFSLNTVAQSVNLDQPLSVNPKIKKGVLSNGLTYYIYNTDVTKNAASYYIIQNVGSVLEHDDQQGLAHFLEHMAFNGTKNFEGKSILNTLEKHGAVFGKDINAYTSFDETVYNLNNIPTTPELIDTCLLVLHDWSNDLLLTDEEIDAERGVIKEEWRTRQNGRMRVFKQMAPVMFNNTIYANRMPIGTMEVVENFDYKALRDFYHDWYRTDLQAIAVIGDVDVNVIENKIKTLFSEIPEVTNPKERFIVDIPENEDMLYVLALDDEVTTSQITFGIRHPKILTNETVGDFKEALLNNMVTSMLSARIDELIQKPDAPFLAMYVNYGSHSRTTNTFQLSIYPKPNQQYSAFKIGLEEINRAVSYGFTQEEINRTQMAFTNFYETQISKIDDKSHSHIASEITDNYLENSAMTDISEDYKLITQLFSILTPEDFQNRLKALYTENNRYLMVTGVEGNSNLTFNDALEIINTVENDETLVPYTDAFAGKTLISNLDITAGKIVLETENDAIGATTFTLSNGITVHYKFVNKNKNDVQLLATSYGGTSLLNDDDLPSAYFMSSYVRLSGLGDYSEIDLTKVLAGKTASTTISINDLTETIKGSSVSKDVETLLQMVYLRFVNPRFDEDAYNVLSNNIDNYIIRRSKDINQKIKDSVTVTLYGKTNPKHPLLTSEFANNISFEKMNSIYLERFNDASDFEFFIVGDVTKETLKPLLETYIASIPTYNTSEKWKDNSVNWLSKTINKDLYLQMEDAKSSVRIAYKNNVHYSLKNDLIAQTVGDILQLRFTETLREQEGGTYGARVYTSISKRPKQEAGVYVSFDCNPDKVEQLVAIVHAELKKIEHGDVSLLDLDKTKTNYLKERQQEQDYNKYDMKVLKNFYIEGYNMNTPENFENLVKNITIKDLKAFVSKIMKRGESYEIVVKPEIITIE